MKKAAEAAMRRVKPGMLELRHDIDPAKLKEKALNHP
jgi:hypothetical protein